MESGIADLHALGFDDETLCDQSSTTGPERQFVRARYRHLLHILNETAPLRATAEIVVLSVHCERVVVQIDIGARAPLRTMRRWFATFEARLGIAAECFSELFSLSWRRPR